MANCHDLFHEFHQEIRILSSKKERMKTSKVALRSKIRKFFKENHPEYKPLFFTQGSQKSKNAIRYKDDMADLDDGVYFNRLPDVSATTLQKWVYDAIEGHTIGGQQHKKKCIRVIYANDYHIDLPVLYKTDDMPHPKLAVKNEGWADDDPKEFTKWFNDAKDKEGQLVKETMFMKAWGDERRHNMPSGLCMTILLEKNCQYDDRDDLCLKKTLIALKRDLDLGWFCYMPTHPKDDLFLKYDDTFKSNFLSALQSFIDDATEAINTEDKEKASKLWRKHLGGRFPEYKSSNKNHSKNIVVGLGGVASASKPWSE
tara:strand:- start:1728 stop:2669 length:942 start_codon:yes stop_codon:yes gene_type:complete